MQLKNVYTLILLFLSNGIIAEAQNAISQANVDIVTVQPKIMVVPDKKEGENYRDVLEQDVNRRIAITKVKEAFDNRGFTTVDFEAKLKSSINNSVFSGSNQTDIQSNLVNNSGADVYVTVELDVQKSSGGTSVNLILTAFEISTGNSISNKIGQSGRFYTDDIGKLSSKAVESCAEEFLNTMQKKFTEIVNNGKSVIVDIGFSQGSKYKMSSVVAGLPLSDALEDWMSKNAYKNNYHIQGTTDVKMIFDDVKIPIRDPRTNGNYNSNRFALEIFKFLTTNGIASDKLIQGNTIFITIK